MEVVVAFSAVAAAAADGRRSSNGSLVRAGISQWPGRTIKPGQKSRPIRGKGHGDVGRSEVGLPACLLDPLVPIPSLPSDRLDLQEGASEEETADPE